MNKFPAFTLTTVQVPNLARNSHETDYSVCVCQPTLGLIQLYIIQAPDTKMHTFVLHIEMSDENDQLKRENERLREVNKMQRAELKRRITGVSRT